MAGGEGTRLRPMTTSMPKPLLPVVDRPIMEHVLRLLRRHGLTETVVTVQYLASLVRTYFGDGSELGLSLTYATEERPLGTAGSVANASALLKDDTFLVVSGDALTDIDLTAMTAFHREQGALITVALARRPDPVEFGVTVLGDDHRIVRFQEKPTWGEVISDTVNTGLYVMEPEVLTRITRDGGVDWSADVFPKLLAAGAPMFGFVTDGYWEDVGTFEAYHRAHADVLEGRVQADIDAFEAAPGLWLAEGAEIDPGARVESPAFIGAYSRVEEGATIGARTVLGANVVVRSGASVERSVLLDNVFVGHQAQLRGSIVGRNTDVMRGARLDEGSVIGEECVLGDETIVGAGVRVYPGKTIEAGSVLHESVIWESRGQRLLFGNRGVSGIVNVEITPELVVRLASAFATTLPKGATVSMGRDHSRAARALSRAVAGALTAAAVQVRDLRTSALPIVRSDTARNSAGGVMVRTSPGVPESVDLVFMDRYGRDLAPEARKKIERVMGRQEYRRAFPGEIGELETPSRAVEDYTQEVLRRVDITGVREAGLKVVVDTAGGTSALVLPTLLGDIGISVMTVNGRLDVTMPTETDRSRAEAMERLGELVASSHADVGVRFDPTAERLSLVDETGRVFDDGRALLVMLDLVAAERRHGTVALPVTTTRVAEEVTAFHNVGVTWTRTAPDDLARASEQTDLVFGGDGRGGFVVPEAGPSPDALATFVRLLGLVARTQLTLSAIDARIPQAFVVRYDLETPWVRKAGLMRAVLEAAGDRMVDTTDGVRVVEPDGSWALVLPDPEAPLTRVWAEASSQEAAEDLADEWTDVVGRAAR